MWTWLWQELREIAWLASVIGALSLLGVVLAVALAFALDSWAAAPAAVLPPILALGFNGLG